jgi:tetratricopeptide (TPR) repeat protein
VSGDATFAGTNYQASVIAYVFVHVLTETKLRWIGLADDTPSAVSGEVGGPGDDARIEFRAGGAPIEIQAKHGLKPQKCIEAFEAIRDGSTPADTTEVMLVVDSTSSPAIRNDLWRDLDRLRSGRGDALKDLTRNIVSVLGSRADDVTRRTHILTLDLGRHSDPGATRALEILTDSLSDESQAVSAWSVLEKDAALMCAEKTRRTKQSLLDVLARAGISVRPPRQTRRWHEELRYTKKLLADDEPTLALSLLREIESDFTKSGARDGQVLYRISQHRASALLQLGRYGDALLSAQRALDHDPDGIHALVNLANAQGLGGDIDAAIATADRAIAKHPQSASAWLMRFQLSLELGQTAVNVPPDVGSTSEFRTDLVRVHLFHGEVSQARDVSASLIKDGDRSALVLLLRVEALFADIETAAAAERQTNSQEVERLCTEILDSEASLSASRTQRALVSRSLARRILGNIAGAQEDSERAHSIRPSDERALNEAAQARIQAGDEAGALEILVGAVVDNNPLLRAMRASLLAGQRQQDKARSDLDAVLQAIPTFHQPDALRSAAAEAALHLRDVPLAKKLVGEMSSTGHADSPHYMVTSARIAALENDFAEAEKQYRRAIEVDPAHRTDLLIELGSNFLRARKSDAAVQVLQEVGPLPEPAERLLVQALILSDRLLDAHKNLERLAAKGPMPHWAVAFAAQIALRRNDPKTAAIHLEDLFSRGVTTPDGRLTLAKTLLELKDHERARFHARALVSDAELTSRETMFLAQILSQLGDTGTAIQLGMRAFRDLPHDAELNRAFASIVFLSNSAPIELDRVGPDSHVLFRDQDQKTLEYLIFADPAPSKLPNEITLEEARKAGLVDLRVGDVFTQDKGAFFERRWRVEQIQSAVKYLVNDIVGNYGTRFPSEPFFARGFHFDAEKPSIADFQPLIASTHGRGQRQSELLKLYQDQCLPLAPVAELAGVSVPALITELSRPSAGRPFYVEFHDEGRLASRSAARSQLPTILTRSALHTAQTFEILPLLTQKRRCLAPTSLREELEEEFTESDDRVKKGWTVVAASERGVTFQELEAGHPALVAERDSTRNLVNWADTNVEFVPRPLETFSDPRTKDREIRARLGDSSNDALELAMFSPAVLYADDLGLRKLGNELGVASFSTVSLIQVLAEEGIVLSHERDKLLVSLAERHYYVIEVSPEMLIEALTPGRTLQTARDVFSLLAAPTMNVDTAATALVRGVKMVALQGVKTTTAGRVIREGLEAMRLSFQPLVVARAVVRVANAELVLLPRELQLVKGASVEFLKSRALRS